MPQCLEVAVEMSVNEQMEGIVRMFGLRIVQEEVGRVDRERGRVVVYRLMEWVSVIIVLRVLTE